jgi:trimethylamine--corrinoid protein Co-methyltransferase
MTRVNYQLTGGLSEKQLDHMHSKAVDLVELVGVSVPHEGIKRRLAGHEGVRIEGDVVRFEGGLVERMLKRLSYDWDEWKDWRVVAGAYALHVYDAQKREFPTGTYDDMVRAIRLAASYGFEGSAPIRPTDVPQALQEVAMARACFEHSPRFGGGDLDANPQSTPEVTDFIREMAAAAERSYNFGLWVISPFKFSQGDLATLEHLCDEEIPSMWIATMPVAGATAPIHLVNSYIQSLAELFATYTLLQLVTRAKRITFSIIDSVRAYPFDMKYGAFVYGSPEDLLMTLIQVQLNRRYGVPIIAKSLLSCAKEPDAHAGAERCAHTVAAALAGAHGFTNAGLLSVDEVYSFEQLVIDAEIVAYARRVVKGYPYDGASTDTSPTLDVGIGGQFLDHTSTVHSFRSEYWFPELFDHPMLVTWRQQGAHSVVERARQIASKRIAEYDYDPGKDVRRELERIYASARKHLAG